MVILFLKWIGSFGIILKVEWLSMLKVEKALVITELLVTFVQNNFMLTVITDFETVDYDLKKRGRFNRDCDFDYDFRQ